MGNNILILGAGLAGLSAAYHLGSGCEIFEKEPEAGGLCRSKNISGFKFDYAVHAIYSSDQYAGTLIEQLLDGNISRQARRSWVYSNGVFTPYPFQANTFGLPREIVQECVEGFISAKSAGDEEISAPNFEKWIYNTFGKGIAEHFMIPYNSKLWAFDLREMNADWVEGRIPCPKLEDVLEGSQGRREAEFGPNAQFWYPADGGIDALPKAFLRHAGQIHLNSEAAAIYPDKRLILFANGDSQRYGKLISSLPLTKLVGMMDSVPASIGKAVRELKYNRVYVVNIGVNRAGISDMHWVYYPEQKFVFHRISFPMNFSTSMAPENTSSISAEVSTPADGQINKGELVRKVINDLISVGTLQNDDEILLTDVTKLEPAYVIYSHSHSTNVKLIHEFLEEREIYPCGRFGAWEYYNMDHAILSGKAVAEKVI